MDRTELPEEIRKDTPIPVPVTPLAPSVHVDGVTIENVNRAHKPSALVPGAGERGDDTQWDASSLDEAIRWLESHAAFLNNQSHKMAEIQDWMGGKDAATGAAPSPLGTFDRASDLATKHAGLYDSTQRSLRKLSGDLYKAANALREVKENYETAERANAMSAAEMERVFGDASSNRAKA